MSEAISRNYSELLKEFIGTYQYARAAHLGGVRAFFADLYDRDSTSESLRKPWVRALVSEMEDGPPQEKLGNSGK